MTIITTNKQKKYYNTNGSKHSLPFLCLLARNATCTSTTDHTDRTRRSPRSSFALLPLLWKAHAAFSFCRFCSKLACSSAFSSLASPVLVPRHGETAMARPVAVGEAAELAPDIHGLGESRMSRLVHTQCSSIPILARSASVMLFLFAIGQWSGRKGREGGRE